MNNRENYPVAHTQSTGKTTTRERFVAWIKEPMGSVIAASAATIGSFGIVLGGTWAISLAVN
ncbi:MAG: hypothetical protein Hals2KO_12580 [Halioglobus sp.]